MKLQSVFEELVKEATNATSYNAWITPDNKVIKVSSHFKFMRDYYESKERRFNDVYREAFLDNWVRVVFIDDEPGELNIEALTKERVLDVFSHRYRDYVLHHPFRIIIDTREPRKVNVFSTLASYGKEEFKEFLGLS